MGVSGFDYSVPFRDRTSLIRLAWVKHVDPETMAATIEYLDTMPGSERPKATLPTTSAGQGWGMFSGIEEGAMVAVGHTRMSQPVILTALPMQQFNDYNLYHNYKAASIMTDNVYQKPKQGQIVLQSKTDASLIVGNGITLTSSSKDYVKIAGDTRAFVTASEQTYLHDAAMDVRSGTTKRDIGGRIRSKDDDLTAELCFGDDLDPALRAVGIRTLESVASSEPLLAMASSVEYLGHSAEIHNQEKRNFGHNEAFAEHRELYREFSRDYLTEKEQEVKASKNDNFFNLMSSKNNSLELGDNDLIEIIKGPIIDINGVLLDINHMPLDTDILRPCPRSEKETIKVNGVSVSGTSDDTLSYPFPTRANNAAIYSFQANTLGTDYKREMHYTLGEDGKKVFEGFSPGTISKNWAYDTALDSSIWGNVNPKDLTDSLDNKGAHLDPLFQFTIDKNGAFKLHVPASSLEHPVAEWTKYDFDDAAEVSVEKDDGQNHYRTKEKNKNLFDRVMRYGGELFHAMHQTSMPTVGADFRVIEHTFSGEGGPVHKHYAMISPVGVSPEEGKATRQSETNLFDNNGGKSQNPAYCPIGQSGKISLDGRLDISMGRDHADWKSLVADLRGGAVLRIGRMYDEQSCECVADSPWGTSNVKQRSGKANDDGVFNDRRSVVFETDGVVTGTLGRSIERELSLDLNAKAGMRFHVGKANYGVKLSRKLVQFSRDYDPEVQYDPASKKNMGYRYFESSQPTDTWDENKEDRHDKIAFNPRYIDGTFKGFDPSTLSDNSGAKATPSATNAVATRSIDGGAAKEHHQPGHTLDAPVPSDRANARTMHWLMEEIANVVNNRHRSASLGESDSSVRNTDPRLAMKMDARDSEAGSININAEAGALITLRDDLDYGNLRGNRTSLRLDTSGQIAAWVGADIDDYRSISLECDGAMQSVFGKTKAEGKSIYGLLKGGIKMVIGLDNGNVEHNTDEGLLGFPSPGKHAYDSGISGTGKAKGGKLYSEVGYHPHINQATTALAGAVEYEPTDSWWASSLNGGSDCAAIQHVDLEGTSANIKTQGSTWFTMGMNADKESVVLDTAGSLVAQVGVDQWNRSGIIHCDGSMSVYLGKESGGDSLHVQMAGGANIAIKADASGNAVMVGIHGDVTINIDGATNVITNISTQNYSEQITAVKINRVYCCDATEETYSGTYKVVAKSFDFQTTGTGTVGTA